MNLSTDISLNEGVVHLFQTSMTQGQLTSDFSQKFVLNIRHFKHTRIAERSVVYTVQDRIR